MTAGRGAAAQGFRISHETGEARTYRAMTQGECLMEKYICNVCGYEYDPAEHDNVPFDQLPDDWVCPVCGVSKDQFSPA